ncbi:MAG TPA: pyridoxamine 5'-phosphate oxidase family protein [Vineibacter sp.]|nr:pyridoxamine 5'-phosphate oxidase family protein [Vineibacter sp.]
MANLEQHRELVREAIARNSFCTLATASAANRPHVVGVIYAAVEGVLYVNTLETSIKARNIGQNRHVAVCIPVPQASDLPPFCVQFQGEGEVCALRDPRVVGLLAAGRLDAITGHGVLDAPGSCFLRITPGRRVATYGLGVPLDEIMRDPIQAGRSVTLS